MVKIAPSILAADSTRLCDEVNLLEKASADLIHFDVMDGHFVPNITFGPQVLSGLKSCTKLHFDVHLMVNNPLQFIPWFAKAGADIITFHFEASENPIEEINLIKSFGIKAGISIKPQTNIEVLKPYINMVDLILIMSVEPGFGGQKFNDSALNKIKELKQILGNNNHVLLEVDGGINFQTAPLAIDAGADILVAGTAVFQNHEYEKNILKLKGL